MFWAAHSLVLDLDDSAPKTGTAHGSRRKIIGTTDPNVAHSFWITSFPKLSPSISSLRQPSASRFYTYSGCWPTSGGAFRTSTLRLIRPRNGGPSNFAMRSPGNPHPAIYLMRDRDRILGDDFTRHVQDMGIQQVTLGASIPLAKG